MCVVIGRRTPKRGRTVYRAPRVEDLLGRRSAYLLAQRRLNGFEKFAILETQQLRCDGCMALTKRHTVSQKLATLFGHNIKGQVRAKLAAEVREWASLIDPVTSEDEVNLEDPALHDLAAGAALTLGSGSPYNAAVELAFTKANLDPKNPLSWRLLLELFCWAHFGDKKTRGAPGKWTAERYCRLLRDFDRKKSSNVTLSDYRVCEFLSRQPQYRMKNGKPLTAGRLMKVFKEAKDPKFNVNLQFLVDETIEALRKISRERGLIFEDETELRKRLIARNLQWIATSWQRQKSDSE
jgi:hypothetical protein